MRGDAALMGAILSFGCRLLTTSLVPRKGRPGLQRDSANYCPHELDKLHIFRREPANTDGHFLQLAPLLDSHAVRQRNWTQAEIYEIGPEMSRETGS